MIIHRSFFKGGNKSTCTCIVFLQILNSIIINCQQNQEFYIFEQKQTHRYSGLLSIKSSKCWMQFLYLFLGWSVYYKNASAKYIVHVYMETMLYLQSNAQSQYSVSTNDHNQYDNYVDIFPKWTLLSNKCIGHHCGSDPLSVHSILFLFSRHKTLHSPNNRVTWLWLKCLLQNAFVTELYQCLGVLLCEQLLSKFQQYMNKLRPWSSLTL